MGTIINHLIGRGVPTGVADVMVGGTGSSSTVLTAAGTSQGTATLIAGGSVYVSIVSSSGKGVQLPSCDPNSSVDLYNGGASVLGVYGQTGEALAGGSANAVFYVGTKKSARFVKYSSTQWGVNLSA